MTLVLSLNELEALCRKAARGAGLSWGLAEETGKAVRWLAGRGLPGPEALARWLPSPAFSPAAGWTMAPDHWQPEGPALDPLAAGASLADHATLLPGAEPLTLESLAEPLLFLPFLAQAARTRRHIVWIAADGCAAALAPDGGLAIAGAPPKAASAVVSFAAAPVLPVHAVTARTCAIGTETYAVLDRLAVRTYAPSTETSRSMGAGAGLTDND
jgi:hypothetical protein